MAQLSTEIIGDERETLLLFIENQRAGIREALEGLTPEQAASRPSASELSLSGLVKHASEVEFNWLRMAQRKPNERQRTMETWNESFQLVGDETIEAQLAQWEEVGRELTAFVRDLPSLDETFPLPDRPWFPKDAKVSMRWMLLHLVEEYARHAGHADVVRESIDGRKAMG
jgi:uncharacterized damage-inducible protein DinB